MPKDSGLLCTQTNFVKPVGPNVKPTQVEVRAGVVRILVWSSPKRPAPTFGSCWSGWGDLNSRPSVPQIDAPQTADLRKRPKACCDLQFWLITGSRWFALFRYVSRPVRGLPERQGVTPRWLPVWLPRETFEAFL